MNPKTIRFNSPQSSLSLRCRALRMILARPREIFEKKLLGVHLLFRAHDLSTLENIWSIGEHLVQ